MCNRVDHLDIGAVANQVTQKWASKAVKSKDWLSRFAVVLAEGAQQSLLQLWLDDQVEVVQQQVAARRLSAIDAVYSFVFFGLLA